MNDWEIADLISICSQSPGQVWGPWVLFDPWLLMPVITLCPKLPYVPLTSALGSRAKHHSGTNFSELSPRLKTSCSIFSWNLKPRKSSVREDSRTSSLKSSWVQIHWCSQWPVLKPAVEHQHCDLEVAGSNVPFSHLFPFLWHYFICRRVFTCDVASSAAAC